MPIDDSAFVCPHCDHEEPEAPENLLGTTGSEGMVHTCDNCGKKYNAEKVIEITYHTFTND